MYCACIFHFELFGYFFPRKWHKIYFQLVGVFKFQNAFIYFNVRGVIINILNSISNFNLSYLIYQAISDINITYSHE